MSHLVGKLFTDITAGTLSILLMASMGVYLKLKGCINKDKAKIISKIQEQGLFPCLIFSILVQNIEVTNVRQWMPVLIVTITCIAIGFFIGFIGNKYIVRDDNFEGLVILATGLGHTTNIQLNLSYSIKDYLGMLNYDSNPQYQSWDTEQKEQQAYNRALVYIIMNTLIHTIFRWSVGKYIIQKTNEKLQRKRSQSISESCCAPIEMALIDKEKQKQITAQQQEHNSLNTLQQIASETNSLIQKSFYDKYFYYMNPPLWGCVASLIVAAIPFIRNPLIEQGTFLNRSLFHSTYVIGRVFPPVNLLILGHSIHESFKADVTKLKSNALCGIIFIRHFLYPIVIWIYILFLETIGIINDPVLSYITLLTCTTGMALNLLIIAINYSNLGNEVSKILGVGYLLNVITIPVAMTLFFSSKLQ